MVAIPDDLRTLFTLGQEDGAIHIHVVGAVCATGRTLIVISRHNQRVVVAAINPIAVIKDG